MKVSQGRERNALGRFRPEMTVAQRLDKLSIPEPNSGCLLWMGRTDHDGYGRMDVVDSAGKRSLSAHRVAFELEFGEITNGLFVLHRCDTPLCINPDHLFLGTQKENCQDTARKGRGTKSKSGMPFGVKRHRLRFTAHVKVDGRMIHLGTFASAEEASAAAVAAKLAALSPMPGAEE